MPTIYDMPNATNSQDLVGVVGYVSDLTGGLLFPVILLCIWLITFITTLRSGGVVDNRSAAGSFTFANFIAFILSIPLVLLKYLKPQYMYLALILTAFGIIWVYLSDSD